MPHGRTCASGAISFSNAAGDCRSIAAAYADNGLETHVNFSTAITSSGTGNRTLCTMFSSGAAWIHYLAVGQCVYINVNGTLEDHTVATIINSSKFTIEDDLSSGITMQMGPPYHYKMCMNWKMSDYYRVATTAAWPTRINAGDPVDADIVHPQDKHHLSLYVTEMNITSGNPISFSNFYCTGGTYCAVMVAGSTAALSIGWARCGSGQSQVVTENGSYPEGGPLRCIGYLCNDKHYRDTYPTDDDENVGRESWGTSKLGTSPVSGNPIGCCVGGPYATHAAYCLKGGSYQTATSYYQSLAYLSWYCRAICFNFFGGIYPGDATPSAGYRWYYRHNGAGIETSYCLIYMHWDGRNVITE